MYKHSHDSGWITTRGSECLIKCVVIVYSFFDPVFIVLNHSLYSILFRHSFIQLLGWLSQLTGNELAANFGLFKIVMILFYFFFTIFNISRPKRNWFIDNENNQVISHIDAITERF